MRKIALHCGQGEKHYRAAAQAITTIGMTKGFRQSEQIITGEVDNEGRGIFGEGAYQGVFVPDRWVVVHTWVETCKLNFSFTWPDLRLVAMKIESCTCGGRK